MYINAIGNYIPEERLPNEYFLEVNGLTSDWIYQRTGIKTRSKASVGDNTNTMAAKAVSDALKQLTYPVDIVDLIVGASYTPHDSVFTLAHHVQREFGINNAQVIYVSAACSSLVNALEIVEGYFATGKAKRALVVASEHNTAYSNFSDPQSGHLWGDAAVAVFVSKDTAGNEPQIIDIHTRGMGHVSKANEAVNLRVLQDRVITMPDGRDVFVNAITYMQEGLGILLDRNSLSVDDLTYVIGHQANSRIIAAVTKNMGVPEEKVLSNISEFGNTGCPSNMLVLSQHWNSFKAGDLVGLTVFGGGYSCGAYLVRF